MRNGYFKTFDGANIYYADIERAIDTLHPECRWMHMYDQLKILGLFNTFMESETPCVLPHSFTGCSAKSLIVAA